MGTGGIMNQNVSYLTLPDRKLAYQQRRGPENATNGKPLFFLGGYASDMTGTKAGFLDERCGSAGRGFTRFDYRGHGQSSGAFVDGTIGDWFEDALAVFDRLTEGPQILVGSSMGGWIGLLLARVRPERVAGFVGIAAAPDFTEELIVPNLSAAQREQLEREGLTYDPDAPSDHRVPMTKRLIEEARERLVLRAPLALDGPVHLLQGQKDAEVPWRFALRVAEHIESPSVRVTMVKDADHRLSRPEDLELLWQTVEEMG
jgi:pimeloyl-ACP methyl ester carboxylesterase